MLISPLDVAETLQNTEAVVLDVIRRNKEERPEVKGLDGIKKYHQWCFFFGAVRARLLSNDGEWVLMKFS